MIRAALLYGGAAVTVVEGGKPFHDALGLPAWTAGFLASVALSAIPLVLVLAWTVRATSDGLEWARAWDGWPRSRYWPRPGAKAALSISAVVALAGAARAWGPGPAPDGDGAKGPVTVQLDPNRIAVLDPATPGAPPWLAAFAANLHQRLIHGLTVEPIVPISRAGVLPFRGRSVRIDSVARVLGTGTIIDPSLFLIGDTIEVRLDLVDGATGEQLGARAVLAPVPGRIGLVDAVADSVIALLRSELGPTVRRRQRLLETDDPAAFDHLMRAAAFQDDFGSFMRSGDVEAAARALRDADRELALAERADPGWAEPIVVRGWLTESEPMLAAATGTPRDVADIRTGLSHAARALARSPDHPRALELRGALRFRLWRFDRPGEALAARALLDSAETDLRRASADPAVRPRALRLLSEIQAGTDRYAEALRSLHTAWELDPYLDNLPEIVLRLYQYSFEVGRDSAAAYWCDEGWRRFGGEPQGFLFRDCRLELMAWSRAAPPDPERARALAGELIDAYPDALRRTIRPRVLGHYALALARNGQPDSALRVLDRLDRDSGDPASLLIMRVAVLGVAGRTAEADSVMSRVAGLDPAFVEMMRDRRVSREIGRLGVGRVLLPR